MTIYIIIVQCNIARRLLAGSIMESRGSILHILHRFGSVEQMEIRTAIRQYFQKRTAFDEEKRQRIKLAQDRLNGRPRRVLD